MWSAVLLQYGSCFVPGQTADLHQLPGKHFSHCLTLWRKEGKKTNRICLFTSNKFIGKKKTSRGGDFHLVFHSTVVELCKRNERAGGDPSLLFVTRCVSLQLSGATDQRSVLKHKKKKKSLEWQYGFLAS